VNDANTAENWAFTLVDARFSMNRQVGGIGLRPFLGIENLFDTRHNPSVTLNAVANRFYEPGPGRTVYLGLSAGAGL
jgi:iron complex outermembrane recepter protein